jgi:hypothetical protein
MKAAIIQSNYLPWKGYFDIIHSADVFIFHDNLQYTKQDWRNRNYIKSIHGGRLLLTVPIQKHSSQALIQEVSVCDDGCNKRHLGAIEAHYSKSKYFTEIQSLLKDFYTHKTWASLSEMNQFMIRRICDYLGIKTKFLNAGDLHVTGVKTERLIRLLKEVGASSYISGPSGRQYIDERLFEKEKITLIYKNYSDYPEYLQSSKPFIHEVSIIDVLMNRGQDSADVIWKHRNATMSA